jgi:small subunit ribosomal protein S18
MARDRERRKGASTDRRRVQKKKVSILTQDRIDYVDYKDVNLLRRFMSERAKIRARRVTGNDQKQQAAVSRAIKLAREMALLPYSVRQVTQRSKGRRDRDRGDRADREREMQAAEAEAETAEASAEATADEDGADAVAEAVEVEADA